MRSLQETLSPLHDLLPDWQPRGGFHSAKRPSAGVPGSPMAASISFLPNEWIGRFPIAGANAAGVKTLFATEARSSDPEFTGKGVWLAGALCPSSVCPIAHA